MAIQHFHFESLSSTQDRTREMIAKQTLPFLVTARLQTAGRGRLGRDWISPAGNFYGSLIILPYVPPSRYGEYSFLAAVALRETIKSFSGGKVTVKWPNDILLDAQKCAGILIESDGPKNEFLIIGMGANLRSAPPASATRLPAVALWPDAEADAARDQKFTDKLLENFANWQKIYEEKGFDAVRTEWLLHAHARGQPIQVQTPSASHTGIFMGIDEQGNLLLTQGAETRKITTADVALS